VLQISAKSNDIMKTSLIHENYILIDINIIPCNRDQLKMNLSNNNGFYCEAPKCNDCNYDNAICVAGYDNPNNDPRKNKCICIKGYEGSNCLEKILYENQYVDN